MPPIRRERRMGMRYHLPLVPSTPLERHPQAQRFW